MAHQQPSAALRERRRQRKLRGPLETVDFVLSVRKDEAKNGPNLKYLSQFIRRLRYQNVKCEIYNGIKLKSHLFICVHLPPIALIHFANLYDVDIHNEGHKDVFVEKLVPTSSFLNTPLTYRRFDLYTRERRGVANSMERILIAGEVLKDCYFREGINTLYGLEPLIRHGIIESAYPLHDGNFSFDPELEDDQLNKRQLLMRHWASITNWHKCQPINTIESYFGTAVAFYFAWFGFYNKMLIFASVVSLCVFIISCWELIMVTIARVDEVCHSNVFICEFCNHFSTCVLKALRVSCSYAKAYYLFDNHWTTMYAIFIMMWSTIYERIWIRRENELNLAWRVKHVEHDTRERSEFLENAVPCGRVSIITKKMLYCIPLKKIIIGHALSFGAYFLLLLPILGSILGVTLFRVNISKYLVGRGDSVYGNESIFITNTACAFIQIIFLKIFELFYIQLAIWLTSLEYPRTQANFDTSVIHKIYILGFANNYIPLFYVAFFQGRFFVPAHYESSFFDLRQDLCHELGCNITVCTQIVYYFIFKSLAGNIISGLILPPLRKLFRKKSTEKDLPQWEKDHKLADFHHHLMVKDFMEITIQYGLVTFFVAAFPLAPFCALLNNLLELRLDATKFVTMYRRPMPTRQVGMGPWLMIFKVINRLGITINAFVIAFTSDNVPRLQYLLKHSNLNGYINSTLSEFDLKPLNFLDDPRVHLATKYLIENRNHTTCYYRGGRHPPGHKKAYRLTDDFIYELALRFLTVIVIEYAIFIFRMIMTMVIPEVPRTVKLIHNHELTLELEAKTKMMMDEIKAGDLVVEDEPVKKRMRKKND